MRHQTRVRKFAKEARARMLRNEYEKTEQKVPSNRVFKIAKDPSEDRLYALVCKMALSDEIITNPLAQLIDNETFARLEQNAKSKYICNLSNKYVSLLERFRAESVQAGLSYASVLD